MEYRYLPKGVCSREMIIQIEGDTITSLRVEGGCAGNSAGVCKLVAGRKIADVIATLKGIQCGYKGTSCPDQLAKALEEITHQDGK